MSELEYLRRRADEETVAALSSADPAVARTHSTLAALYTRKIVQLSHEQAMQMPSQRSTKSR